VVEEGSVVSVVVRKRVAVVVANLKWNLASGHSTSQVFVEAQSSHLKGQLWRAPSPRYGAEIQGDFASFFTTPKGQKSSYQSQSRANLSDSHWRSRSLEG
jgi:hypothetical protein